MDSGGQRDRIPPIDRVPRARRATDRTGIAARERRDHHNVSLIIDVTWDRGDEQLGMRDGTVLEHISWIIMATVRTTDIVYRHGHAQFCVPLPASSADAGETVAERIRDQIDRSDVLSTLGIELEVLVDGRDPSTGSVDESVDRAIGVLGDAASSGPQIATTVNDPGSIVGGRPSTGAVSARTRFAVQGRGAPVPPIGDLSSVLLPD